VRALAIYNPEPKNPQTFRANLKQKKCKQHSKRTRTSFCRALYINLQLPPLPLPNSPTPPAALPHLTAPSATIHPPIQSPGLVSSVQLALIPPDGCCFFWIVEGVGGWEGGDEGDEEGEGEGEGKGG